MNRRQMLLLSSGTAVAAAFLNESKLEPSLSVKVIPSLIKVSDIRHNNQIDRYISLSESNPHLNVVIQNCNKYAVNLWTEGNSWGFHNLSFEVTKIAGKLLEIPLEIRRGEGAFLANFPSILTLPPGEMIEREAQLLTLEAEKQGDIGSPFRNFPLPLKWQPSLIEMRAILEIQSSALTRKYKVWTGRIASPLTEFHISLDRYRR